MINHKKILYFSTNFDTRKSFAIFCKKNNLSLKCGFELVDQEFVFNSAYDLKIYLENSNQDLHSLYIIIDYLSLCSNEQYVLNADIIRNLLLSYPEVHFFFDDSYVKHIGLKADYRIFLFNSPCDTPFIESFHSFCITKPKDESDEQYVLAFDQLLNQRNNIFDVSNLRYVCKTEKYKSLSVRGNFCKLQESRRDNLACVIEEERAQNLFNSYVLYANGFRVLSITSARELKYVNDNMEFVTPPLILRDYDLQFADEGKMHTAEIDNCDLTIEENNTINEVDKIRGFKRHGDEKWVSLLNSSNPYWGRLIAYPTYFVTKSDSTGGIDLEDPSGKQLKCYLPSECNNKLSLYGLSKPINGIYATPQHLHEIRKRYIATRYNNVDDIIVKTDPMTATVKITELYPITTRRIDNDHSTPLDIYDMVRSMVKRSEHYYSTGRYLYAALLSSEAIEVVNGFHLTLMLKAYYINAVAENALAVRLLGANESKLCEDTRFRLGKKVPEDLERMCQNAPEFKRNMLVSIYNEARRFCKEKEHFESAEVALSLLVHENHKLSCDNLIKHKDKDVEKHSRFHKLTLTWEYFLNRIKEIKRFVWSFPVSFIVLISMIVLSITCSPLNSFFFWSLLGVYIVAIIILLINPMQIVYGLVGTKGDIRKFILMFGLTIACFSITYYTSFFKDSGVTYNMDVPQVEYKLFDDETCLIQSEQVEYLNSRLHDVSKGMYVDCCNESFVHNSDEVPYRYYKRITFLFVLRQTFMTSLTTSPTDFFNSVSLNYKNNEIDSNYTRLFNLMLLYQTLVSWIFLGVFISLIYQKFRNE